MQDRVLLEALRHLIGGVRAQGVEERRPVRGNVLGDDDAVLGHRVDIGIEALEGAHAGVAGQVAVENASGTPAVRLAGPASEQSAK